jgi:hypothetical protein
LLLSCFLNNPRRFKMCGPSRVFLLVFTSSRLRGTVYLLFHFKPAGHLGHDNINTEPKVGRVYNYSLSFARDTSVTFELCRVLFSLREVI